MGWRPFHPSIQMLPPVVNVFSYVRNGTSVTFSWETTFQMRSGCK